ncbi:hypothetical protein [Streptomyces sp. NPDC054783]
MIGAGGAGLTTAVCLAESGWAVRVDSDRPPGETSSRHTWSAHGAGRPCRS